MIDRKLVENIVRKRVLAQIKGKDPLDKALDFVNEQQVMQTPKESAIVITHNAIITPLAKDLAEQMGVRFEMVLEKPLAEIEEMPAHTIALGSDHGGFALKEQIENELKKSGYPVYDVGTHNTDAVDYPDFAYAVAILVASGRCRRGILVDGAGIGSAIVANKVQGIRAAHCRDLYEISNSREHNDANILTLGSQVIGPGLALRMVKEWLVIPFEGGRHQRRIDKITQIDRKMKRS